MSISIERKLSQAAVAQVLGFGLTFLVGVQLARYLGPVAYGIYGVAMATVAIAAVASQLGLPILALREVAKPTTETAVGSKITWFYLQLSKTMLVGVGFLALLTLFFFSGDNGKVGLIGPIIILTVLLGVFNLTINIIRGLQKNFTSQVVEGPIRAGAFAACLSIAYLYLRSLDATQALVIHATSLAIVTIAALVLVARAGGFKNPSGFEVENWKSSSLMLTSTAIMLVVNTNLPILIGSLFLSASDLGQLRVAMSLLILVTLPSSIANITTAPLISRLADEQQWQTLRSHIASTTFLCFVLTFIGVIALVAIGKPLITVIFGPQYAGSWSPLVILALGQLLIAYFGVTGTFLNMVGQENAVARAFAIAIPIGAICALVLTPIFGIVGAASSNLAMAAAWHFLVFRRLGGSLPSELRFDRAIARRAKGL